MLIDIVSDTICPWCFIGKRKLEAAMQNRSDVQPEIGWRPFQLNPEMPRAGMSRDAYLSAKFGGADRAARIYETIRAAGAELGIPFRFDLIKRTPSTLDSHRLIRWATQEGLQDRIVEALFIAYFTQGADIGDADVLTRIAVENGMDPKVTGDRLRNDTDLDLVRQEDAMARSMGINGVPCFIIDRKYAVSGAQDVPVFHKVFDLALNETVPAPEMTDAD
ncbi:MULTISPECIES: DsbA family oxidoreductase [unclassified Minwuia]|jgi:predicted DsbA family dithiol-disulfide isomerase|uniref:DsbA family oxidoreductase n=1 Tax=unclassified Minwuia TaxID=2618799 RepID=UPI00247905E0|nr:MULTISPECIES: DsbA family oxidoreductase [unclassified Minwuia]